MRRLTLAVMATMLALTASNSASALTTVNPPWSSPFLTYPVNAYIGSITVRPPGLPAIVKQAIVWQRRADGACNVQMIGGPSGLYDDYQVVGTSGNDRLSIQNDWGSCNSFCNVTICPLSYGGHYLDLFGGNGNDYLSCWSGDTYLMGEGGADGMYCENALGLQSGGPGNDSIYGGYNGAGSERMFGGDGNDCMSHFFGGVQTFDCGAGTDSAEDAPAYAISCELQTNSCPISFIP